MNIFNKVTLQGMKKSRTRTVVTIIGVVLSSALITAVATFGVSLLDYMTNGAAHKYGGWHVEFTNVAPSFVREQAVNGQVAGTATFENIGYAKLDGAKSPKKPYLFIAGFGRKAFDILPITLLSGRLPKNGGEVIVSGSAMTKGGAHIAVGDTLSLAVGKRMDGNRQLGQHDPYISGNKPGTVKETLVPRDERTYTIVGICQTPAFEGSSAPGYTLITTTDAADTADDLSLFVTLKNLRRVHSYARGSAGSHAYILNNNVLRFKGLSDDPSDKIFTALLFSVGGIVIAIIMVGSVFLIYNSFNISLNERTHQFGILSSVGATGNQLRNSVLFEGLCIGAVGIPIGVLVGMASTGLVIDVVARNFANILYAGVPLTLTASIPAIVGAAVVSVVTITVSAYIPARKAANTPVMESIRQTNEVKVESGAVKTSKLAERIFGLEGTLALKNFKRNKKRYRSIVLSLVLSVVLFVATSAFVTYLKQASMQAKAVTSYDIGLGTQDMDDRQMMRLYDKLKTADGVYESSYQVVKKYSCSVNAGGLSDAFRKSIGANSPDKTVELPMTVQFLDDGAYLKIIKDLGLPVEGYTGPKAKIIAIAKMQGHSNRDEGVHDLGDIFKASSMDLAVAPETKDGPKMEWGRNLSVTFVETMPPDTPPYTGTSKPRSNNIMAMAPYSLLEKQAPSDTAENLLVKGLTFKSKSPSRSLNEMKTMIQEAGTTAAYIILNTSEMLDESRNYIFIANVFAYTFIIMISLIAVANVFNTISTNIKLRRRELAMLRSVGMSDGDFNRMMRFECAFYGLRALVVGLPLAILSSWLIYKGMFIGGAESIEFVVPWASMGISVFSVLLVIFVTMMYAVNKIRKENIIDALRDDMD